jgi:hypothetical protein
LKNSTLGFCNISVSFDLICDQNLSFDALNSTIRSSSMQWIRDIERYYAFPALTKSVYLYADNADVLLAAVQPIRIGLLIIYLLLTAGMYFFYFQPLVWQVRIIQLTRSLI